MTAVRDWLRIAEWEWVTTGGDHLHAPGWIMAADDEMTADGTTACAIVGQMLIPGPFTRMGARRCLACCDAVGMPQGDGSPKNDAACRPVAEKRAARWRGGESQ